jgi:hypothetical protein
MVFLGSDYSFFHGFLRVWLAGLGSKSLVFTSCRALGEYYSMLAGKIFRELSRGIDNGEIETYSLPTFSAIPTIWQSSDAKFFATFASDPFKPIAS